MRTSIRKWGNSQGLRLPRALLAEAGLAVGDVVDVQVRDGVLVILPERRVRGRYRVEDLLADMPADWEPEEVDWGAPVGREVW